MRSYPNKFLLLILNPISEIHLMIKTLNIILISIINIKFWNCSWI